MTSTRPPFETTNRKSSNKSRGCFAMIGIRLTGVPTKQEIKIKIPKDDLKMASLHWTKAKRCKIWNECKYLGNKSGEAWFNTCNISQWWKSIVYIAGRALSDNGHKLCVYCWCCVVIWWMEIACVSKTGLCKHRRGGKERWRSDTIISESIKQWFVFTAAAATSATRAAPLCKLTPSRIGNTSSRFVIISCDPFLNQISLMFGKTARNKEVICFQNEAGRPSN